MHGVVGIFYTHLFQWLLCHTWLRARLLALAASTCAAASVKEVLPSKSELLAQLVDLLLLHCRKVIAA